MRERSPEFQASLERALTNLFTFSPESMERISPFREVLEEQRRELEEERRNASMNAAIQAKREALSLILENKFGLLSEEIVSRLSAVSDVDELDKLLRRSLDAQTLDEVGIPEDNNG